MIKRKSLVQGLAERVPTKQQDLNTLNKAIKPLSVKATKSNTVSQRLEEIRANVVKHLGQYSDKVEILRSEEFVREYFDKIIKNGVCALDTETTGLNCLEDHIVGTCLYTPGEKAVYIPHEHLSYITGQPLKNQITQEFMREQYLRAKENNVKFIFHNAKFDVRIIHTWCGLYLTVYRDTMIAAKLLNNLEKAELKVQYNDKILHTSKSYDFSTLFSSIDYRLVGLDTAVLYAATDALITYELYEWQENELKKNPGIFAVYTEIELPVMPAVIAMEDRGVYMDLNRANELSKKYNALLVKAKNEVYAELKQYSSQISLYRSKVRDCKLSEPINIDSPKQLEILLYDIIGVQTVNKRKPRSTDKEVMEAIDLPLCKKILEYRGIAKLLGTYIDNIPKQIDRNNRLHAKFNQLGADTGRFSSSDPNLQNIPSHNNEIRTMFAATPGYVLLGGDFSKQEPAMLAYYTQDPEMKRAWDEGKDIYSVIASRSFHRKYEDCVEFNPDGSKNPEGKKYRSLAKPIVLGVMYGRGLDSVANGLGTSVEEAQKIVNVFFDGFPKVKPWMDHVVAQAKKDGYVDTFYGRRRYIQDIQLPQYQFEYINKTPKAFNPLDFSGESEYTTDVDKQDIIYYTNKLNKCKRYSDKERVKQEAYQDGIKIRDNSSKLAEAVRKCVNSKIQGGSADQSKLAMVNVWNNKELRDLGFHLLICVHDELIGEAPKENARRCAELLSECMCTAAQDKLHTKITCDVEASYVWYGEKVDL